MTVVTQYLDSLRIPRIAIRTALMLVAVVAAVVPILAWPSAALVYGPLILIVLLGYIIAELIIDRVRSRQGLSQELVVRSNWPIVLAVLSFVPLLGFYLGMLPYAVGELATDKKESIAKSLAFSLADQPLFVEECYAFHSDLSKIPPESPEFSVEGLPESSQIRRLNPLQVIASDNYLFLKMTAAGSGVTVYLPNSMLPTNNVRAQKIDSSVY